MRTWGGAGRYDEARLFIPHEDVVALRRFTSFLVGAMLAVGALAALAALAVERMLP